MMSKLSIRIITVTVIVMMGTVLNAPMVFAITQTDKDLAAKELKKIQQDEELRKKDDLRKLKELLRQRKKELLELKEEEEEIEGLPKEIEKGWKINRIELHGATLLTKKERLRIIRKYAGTCMRLADINALLNDITVPYFKKGYITTRAYIIPGQDLSKGILEIMVVDGKLEKINLEDNKDKKSANLNFAFPGIVGGVLNLRDIEQGLDQINKLPSNNVTIAIQPGEEPGGSILVLTNKPREPFTYSISMNNLGSDSTGKRQISLLANIDNPLGINDSFGFTYRRSIPFDNFRYSSSIVTTYSLPYGYWTFSLAGSYSDYVTRILLLSGNYAKSSGTTMELAGTVDKVLYRDQISRLSVYGTLTIRDVVNYLEGNLIEVSSYDLLPLEVGLNYNTLLLGGLMDSRLAYMKGLNPKALSISGPIGISSDTGPQVQFDNKFKLDLGYTKPFKVGGNNDILFTTRMTSQFAGKDVLYPTEQISIGGFYTVRGYEGISLSGDTGAYLRNDLTVTPGLLRNRLGLREKVDLFVAYDIGRIWGHYGGDSGTMSGWGYGVRLSNDIISLDIMNTAHVKFPVFLTKPGAKLGNELHVLFSSRINGFPLEGFKFGDSDNKWFIGINTGRTTFELKDIYIADARYRMRADWNHRAFDFGRTIGRSRLYATIYDFALENDMDINRYSISFDTKLLDAAISPYIGISFGYISYKEKELRAKNPIFVINGIGDVEPKDEVDLNGFSAGVKVGVKCNWRNFGGSIDYEYAKLYDRDPVYFDGVAGNFEIHVIRGWNVKLTYRF